MSNTRTYQASCHCGSVRFKFRSEEITKGCRFNCSICVRKGIVTSAAYLPPENLEQIDGMSSLALYQFGDKDVNHCKTCGIYPFHDGTAKPGHYRVNLGCIDDLDPLALEITVINGKSW